MNAQSPHADDLITNFEQGLTSPGSFHHADHVRLAFHYLRCYPAIEALDRFCTALKRFAAAQGKPRLYHETITWAYLLLIRERIARSSKPELAWDQFAKENPDLLVWKGGVLATLYRQETLDSDLARETFLLPDLFSFPIFSPNLRLPPTPANPAAKASS